MPANKKYLTQSPWIKLGKLSAATLGSLLASLGLHLALAVWLDRSVIIPIAIYTGFITWVALMILAYWIPKVWQAWAMMAGIMTLSVMAIYLGQSM